MGFPMEERARKRMDVTVEYDGKNGREQKTFPTMGKAKSFYVKATNAGLNPKVISGKAT